MDLQHELRQFTGTESWYRHSLSKLVYTDGVKHFADVAGAYWVIDLIATEVLPLADKERFISITLTVDGVNDKIAATDGNDSELWVLPIDYTNCPIGVYEFYLIDGVLLLRSEY